LTAVKLVSKTSSRGKSGVVAGRVGVNTLAVDVLERHTHKKYGKVFSRTKRYKVHVEEIILNSLQKGDKITMHVSRPLSKTKKLVFDPEFEIFRAKSNPLVESKASISTEIGKKPKKSSPEAKKGRGRGL
jgi:ribosomal protein S17